MKFFCEGLEPHIIDMAERELGESEAVRRKTLIKLKSLIIDEQDFYPCIEDTFLLRFLRAKKFDVKRAFKTLQTFYRFKARNSGTITDLKASDLRDVLRTQNVFFLEDRDKNGAAIAFIRVGKFDLENIPPEKFLAVGLILLECALLIETTQISGYNLIFDIGGITFRNFQRLASFSFIYNLVHSLQDCIPTRIKSIHVINAPFYFDILIKMVKFFLSEKLKKRFHVHDSTLESFHKHISPDLLPEEFGGRQGSMSEQVNKVNAALIALDDHVEHMNKFGYQGKTLEKLIK